MIIDFDCPICKDVITWESNNPYNSIYDGLIKKINCPMCNQLLEITINIDVMKLIENENK